MTVENESAVGANAPAAPDASVQNPVAPAAVPPIGEPEWLPKRIEQARKNAEAETLKALGVDSLDAAKSAIAAAKAKAESEKGYETRATEATAQAAALAAENARLLDSTKEYAARMMVGLTAEQQTAVKALAGEDPARTLSTISALAPTWANAEAAKAAAAASVVKPTTAPAAGAPNGAAPPAPTHRSTYEAMRITNPFAAAAYGDANPEVYEPKK